MIISNVDSCAIFVCADPQNPIVAAKFALDDNGDGVFRYGKSYLARQEAFALDPKHLALTAAQLDIPRFVDGSYGILTDAGPDSWGVRLTSVLCRQRTQPLPANVVQWLLQGAHHGAGCLAFTPDPTIRPPTPAPPEQATELNQRLLQMIGAVAVDKSVLLDEEAVRLIWPGASLGGVRPKTVVLHDSEEHIAKFSRPDDLFNVPAAEYATMRLAHLAGINVPDFELLNLGGNPVLLVKRFDRTPDGGRKHYMSAKTILHVNAMSPDRREYKTSYSYAGIGESVRGFSDRTVEIGHELFRRMVFNIAVGNVDDHVRNHGFLMTKPNNYVLSPAFDLVPHPDAPNLPQSIGVGAYGAASTMENALSQCGRFFLKTIEAKAIIDQVKTVVATWKSVFREAGISEADIYRLASCFTTGLAADTTAVSIRMASAKKMPRKSS